MIKKFRNFKKQSNLMDKKNSFKNLYFKLNKSKFLSNYFNTFYVDFGIEIGTLTTFYSRTHPNRGNLLINKNRVKYEKEKGVEIISQIFLGGQRKDNIKALIIDEIKIENNKKVRRKVKFKVQKGAIIRDLVVRYVLNSSLIKRVELEGRKFKHRFLNRYRQFETNFAKIEIANGKVEVRSEKKISDNRLYSKIGSFFYFRDEPAGDYYPSPWIFHSRFLVKKPEIFCFKGCIPWFNKPFPLFLDKGLQKLGFHKFFLNFRERTSQFFPFQVQGGIKIYKDTIFEIEDTWTWK